jgi:hypothetical protein
MTPPTTCPDCGKDLSTLTPQKAYGHIGGHKRRKSPQTEPNARPNAQKAVFEVSKEASKDLQKVELPKKGGVTPEKAAAQMTEGLNDLVKLALDLVKELEDPESAMQINAEDVERASRAISLLDAKYHFGVEGATSYFPEIFACVVFGIIVYKITVRLLGKKGRQRTATAESIARSGEPATQSTDAAFEIFKDPRVAKGIEEAFNASRAGET